MPVVEEPLQPGDTGDGVEGGEITSLNSLERIGSFY
jgi:hypothetical protein